MDRSLIDILSDHPDFVEKCDIILKQDIKDELAAMGCWPPAVDDRMIIKKDDTHSIQIRAEQILQFFLRRSYRGKRFLDFGTGHAECWKLADGASYAVGYDIDPATDATHDWQMILDARPYDVILLYDVIDHLVDGQGNLSSFDQIVEILQSIRSVLAKDGRIFVRCHPWTSRHGTHAYLTVNRAFVHYDTTAFDGEPTFKTMWPLAHYQSLFRRAGLTVVESEQKTQPVEEIFFNTPFATWKQLFPRHTPMAQIMAINFIDYVLSGQAVV